VVVLIETKFMNYTTCGRLRTSETGRLWLQNAERACSRRYLSLFLPLFPYPPPPPPLPSLSQSVSHTLSPALPFSRAYIHLRTRTLSPYLFLSFSFSLSLSLCSLQCYQLANISCTQLGQTGTRQYRCPLRQSIVVQGYLAKKTAPPP